MGVKIKISYLYLILILSVAGALFYFTSNKDSISERDITEMPGDEIHKGLNDLPGKGNVSESFIEKLQKLKKDVMENPGDTLSLREYADLLAASHKPDEALIYYEKVLSMDPNRIDILFSESFIYYNSKDFLKAESITKKILSIDKNNHLALYNLGAIAASRGDRESANKIWMELIEKFPNTSSSELAKTSIKKL